MRPAALVPLLCSLASPALAEDFRLDGAQGVSFAQRRVVPAAEADVWVQSNVVRAKNGVRLARGREQLASSLALSFGDVMEVKAPGGELQRVRVQAVRGDEVHLVWLDPAGQIGAHTGGTWRNVKAEVGGAPAEPVFGALTLTDDGQYRLGQARGTWKSASGRVAFSGLSDTWGVPEVLAGGDVLVFRFARGGAIWEVRFERDADPRKPADAIADAR